MRNNEWNNAAATDGGSDDVLERATLALRDGPVPEGPSPLLAARTSAALRKTQERSFNRFRHGPWLRIAAAIVVVGGLAGAVWMAQREPVVVVQEPPPQHPAEVDQDLRPGEAVVVEKPPSPNIVPRTPAVAYGPLSEPSARDYPGRLTGFEPEPATFASIIGTVYLDGTAPQPALIDVSGSPDCRAHHPAPIVDDSLLVKDSRIANVVVSIAPAAGQDLPADVPAHPVVLDQQSCRFVPRVVTAMVGQEMIVRNSDPFLHNVHSNAIDNERFNFGQPTVDAQGRRLDPLKLPERFAIKCDLHPWMRATVSVFEHPYFTVSNAEGTFEIPTKGLKDGAYTLVAWHERLGQQQARVIVSNGKAGSVVFHYSISTTADASGITPREAANN